ncbi:MAG: carbon starvation protein A [Spirochaetales bacterium]|nr:carbon starvation protein A [Spirochaetales bacterium]
MFSFILCLGLLVAGYFVYGRIVEKLFGVEENRQTPAYAKQDGVDYVPLSGKRIFLIQLLNIAGLGPIYGAVMGALFGTASFIWIVFGCIFAGAVHDFFSGMMSIRHEGKSISEISGTYLGSKMRIVMRGFSVVLLILVGTVFMAGPAGLLSNMGMTGIFANKWFWLGLILAYYFVATILPIDKIIAKLYPIFGVVLLVMAVGVASMLFIKGYKIPEVSFTNAHPKGLGFFPFLFITIACGAISGFHATQSPIMARCLPDERMGRPVFFGAMIAEGIIALIWAAASVTFFGGMEGLAGIVGQGGAGLVVKEISVGLLGTVGGILAMLGVVACPISSGDTAFRSARLTIADSLGLDQAKIRNRLLIAIPLFAVGFSLNFVNFSIIWRYFAWSNQTLATIVLWTAAVYMVRNGKNHWICSLPAAFMSAVVTAYILQAPEGFRLSAGISIPVGISVAIALFTAFFLFARKAPASEKTVKAA